MSTLNPMFERTKLFTLKDHNKAAQRKQRNDKKLQIKVPVTEEQKLTIARLSLHNGYNGEIHSFLADVFSKAIDRPYLKLSKPVSYLDKGNYVSTKVKEHVIQELDKLKVMWGLRSRRQAAHRILVNELLGG